MRRLAILVLLPLAVPVSGAHAAAGFLAAPTDQLAVPGLLAGAEITPEGRVYTGAAEYAFGYGPRLRDWNVPTRERVAGRYPILVATTTAGAVRYTLTTLIDTVGGEPVVFVHVEARNRSSRAARWRAGAPRRCGRAGGASRAAATPTASRARRRRRSPASTSSPASRSRRALATRPAAARSPATAACSTPTRARRRRCAPAPARAASAATRFGRSDYRLPLAPGATRTVDVRIPVTPRAMTRSEIAALRTTSFAAHRAAVLAGWRATLAPAVALELPEPAVQDAFEASVVQLLEPRYRLADGTWVQTVNKLQYHSFWLRDTAIIAQALDLAGLHVPAAEDLAFFSAWQRPDGLFISRPGQLDGFGQALWGLGEHVRLTGDAAFATAWLPAVQRAVGWLREARAGDPLGLVPPSDPGDNELVAGHLPGDDFWAVAGLDAAAALAAAAGRGDLAADWRGERDALRTATVAAVRAHGGPIPPALDAPGGHDWGNLWAAWPYPVLAPGDRQVTATLRSARRNFAEGIATYGDSLHGYLGFRVFQTELARGEQRHAVDGLYASLAHLTATDGCFELGTRPYGRRLIADDLAPHAWCSAEIVALVRNMLVRERGGGIQLLAAPSPRWLGHGRRLALRGAPTAHGRVDVALRSTRRTATLRWHAPAGVPVSWTVPAGARGVRVGGRAVSGRLVRLPAASGRLRITWRLAADGRSLARTQRRLAAAYVRRGTAAALLVSPHGRPRRVRPQRGRHAGLPHDRRRARSTCCSCRGSSRTSRSCSRSPACGGCSSGWAASRA